MSIGVLDVSLVTRLDLTEKCPLSRSMRWMKDPPAFLRVVVFAIPLPLLRKVLVYTSTYLCQASIFAPRLVAVIEGTRREQRLRAAKEYSAGLLVYSFLADDFSTTVISGLRGELDSVWESDPNKTSLGYNLDKTTLLCQLLIYIHSISQFTSSSNSRCRRRYHYDFLFDTPRRPTARRLFRFHLAPRRTQQYHLDTSIGGFGILLCRGQFLAHVRKFRGVLTRRCPRAVLSGRGRFGHVGPGVSMCHQSGHPRDLSDRLG